jgi:hypothetical protein
VSEQRYRDFLTDRTGIVTTAKALVAGMSAVRRTEMQRGKRLNLASLACPIPAWRFSEEINHDARSRTGSTEESTLEQISLYRSEAAP